ncbi:hypothetical protein [Embleya scabrispora]|uniref:hypothetical protein n=1 Tax=Embleya scabrispora TaxID=159449 RepID=UPI00037863B9|nr:hypothetical protein [Embleya scabrispora]MYS83140.1 hypothetical protein [Streptomyces sp. SID5474]
MSTLARSSARPGPLVRAGGAVRGEWRRLTAVPVRELRAHGLSAIPLTVCTVLPTLGFWLAWRTTWGGDLARVLGGVSAGIPLPLALLRTPVSLFVPAPDLPVWGALIQVLILFGLAELDLGARRTLLIAYVATLCGTLSARVMVGLGPDHPLGIDARQGDILDTGPSAAVVGLVVCIAMVRHAPILFTGAWILMVAEVTVKPNLAGREHIAAMAGVTLCAGVYLARQRRRTRLRRPAPTRDRSRAPAPTRHQGRPRETTHNQP